MKKQIMILLLIFLLFSSFIGQVSATTTVFLTSDNVMGNDDEVIMLNSIKNYIEEMSNGNIKVIRKEGNFEKKMGIFAGFYPKTSI